MKPPRHRDKEASVARRGRTGSTPLEVRISCEPRWVSPAGVALAYERVGPLPWGIRARISCKIIENEGILHEVKNFPCCLQEKYPCSCP